LQWAIEYLGVSQYWRIKKSPLELIYLPWGNRILFRGADDPLKLKSIKTARYQIAELWIEELAEFKNEEEVDTIVNSLLRAELEPGLKYSVFYSYNPPKRKQNWVNKKYNSQFLPENVFVHHSSYLDNPYVSQSFLDEARLARERNEHKYKWIYLGEPIGGGVVPFSNLTFRTITEEEITTFDNIRQGNDWGYATDPNAFVRWHYDKTRNRIYAIDEIYGIKMANRELADIITSRGYDDYSTIADSAEPKSIAEMQTLNCDFRSAKKGPGSVEYGEKWLDDLDEIVIDYQRTPNIAREFENIDYQIDKDGNVKTKLEDKDNHTIDATRYSFERDMGSQNTFFDFLKQESEGVTQTEQQQPDNIRRL
jgi:PBSX family phage terminase large subunit